MQLIVLLLVGVLYAPGCMANRSSTIKDAVARALDISKLESALADLHTKRSQSSPGLACPLTKFHNRQLPTTADVTADKSMATMMVALRLLQKRGFSLDDLERDTVLLEFERGLAGIPGCPKTTVSCKAGDSFRSMNGTCNNLRNPKWGMAGAVQRRLLPAAYDDGLNLPRKQGVNGSPLPSPRQVSNAVHRGTKDVTSPFLTLHAFQFGQFLDHDVISTPVTSAVYDCCSYNDDVDNCFNINFAEDDPYQPRFKEGYCMEVKRSSGVNCESSGIGPSLQRQQINKLTSFIDASNVYGSSDEQLQGLRDGNTPFMRVAEGADGPRVPNGNDSTCKAKPDEGIHCSLVGDDRVNVVPSLTSYHNVFILEHNRLAERLREEFPDEEEAFQQTRKLMIAIMQKIVYDEYLPSFLSPLAMKKYKLGNLSPYKYDPSLDPTISNEFGNAYRMGHTWIPMFMAVFTKEFQPSFGRFTNETYEDPSMTYIESQNGGPSGMEGLAYWLSAKKSPATDRILEDVVRNDLFLNPTKDTSFDLAALNIQRGRDHGLPSYNEYRKFCGLSTMSSWRTRFGDLTDAALSRLEEAGYSLLIVGSTLPLSYDFSDPDDVDLFTGALSEKPVPGGALGPTMECIIGDQFHRLKFGDRFFYKNPETGYNRDQIEAIKNYSLASLMCRNYKFERIHFPNIFRVLSPLVDCKDIDDIDLTPFLSSSLPDLPRPPESFPKPIRNIDTK